MEKPETVKPENFIEIKPLTILIGKNMEKSLLLRRLWASAAANDAVYLPAGRACAADGYIFDQPIRLTRSAELLLRDIGVELHVALSTVYVKTLSGRKIELEYAPPSIREVITAVLALSSDDFRFIFIEEPEAHLHPSAQRLMAKTIAEAVNRGKFVVLATNSDYLIGEFNNLIALSALEDVRRKLGYRESEILRPEMVAVYLVKDDGAVERLDVDDSGIPEDEFAKVAIEILEVRNELY
jgi:predicted ATPase